MTQKTRIPSIDNDHMIASKAIGYFVLCSKPGGSRKEASRSYDVRTIQFFTFHS